MYLKRKIDEYLKEWGVSSDRKPLGVKGPRQVGKTESIRRFAKGNYDEVIEINFVEEPNIDDTISILTGIKKYYEEYHKVKISNDVIKQAVIMSEKYIHDRFLPDKAIDILDEACSRINLENKDANEFSPNRVR